MFSYFMSFNPWGGINIFSFEFWIWLTAIILVIGFLLHIKKVFLRYILFILIFITLLALTGNSVSLVHSFFGLAVIGLFLMVMN